MITPELATQAAMLAVSSNTVAPTPEGVIKVLGSSEYLYEIKLDGVRCLAYVDEGKALLRNRRGVNMTSRYPEIVEALETRFRADGPVRNVVFDGELVGLDPSDGRPDFSRIAKRDQLSTPARIAVAAKTLPATLMIFDLLYLNDQDLRRQPLTERLRALNNLVLPIPPSVYVSIPSEDGNLMWTFAEHHRLEGLVAKRKDSRYTGKRDGAWIKLKRNKRLTAIVTGYVPGEGGRQGQVGALLVSLLDADGQLVHVGKVGTGFRDADHKVLMEILVTGQEFLVDVECLELTKDGRLRMPSFKGIAVGATRADATMKQIGQS